MTMAVYKLASADNHDYLIEEEYYYFLAVDESDVDAYLGDGWYLTTPEAKSGTQVATKDALWAQLDSLGIEYDKRWGIEKLQGLLNGVD